MQEQGQAWLGALILTVGLSGCQQPSASSTNPSAGNNSTLRVISLTPNLTELLFALEAGPQVVGVTGNDHFPPEVDKLPNVGGLQINYEALLALGPDLVVLDPELNQQQIHRLRNLGVQLEPLSTQSLADLQVAIQRLGQRLGRQEQAAALLEKLKSELKQAELRKNGLAHRPTCWVEIWHDPWIGAGEASYVGEVVDLAGFRNVHAGQSGYPRLDMEELHRLDPEVIVLTHPIAEQLLKRPGWSQLQAVKNQRVLQVPEDWLVRPGPRVVQALRLMQDWLEQQTWTKPGG